MTCPYKQIADCPLYIESHTGSGHGCFAGLETPCLVIAGKRTYDDLIVEACRAALKETDPFGRVFFQQLRKVRRRSIGQLARGAPESFCGGKPQEASMTDTPPGDELPIKLWLIEQSENSNYDTYDSAVVAASTEAQARALHPSGRYIWLGDADWHFVGIPPRPLERHDYPLSDWTHPANVTATLIGEALPGQQEGVICASFNAG